MGCACSRDSGIKVISNINKKITEVNDSNTSLRLKQPNPTFASNLAGSTKINSKSEKKDINAFVIEIYFLEEKSIITLPIKDNKEYMIFYDLINKSLFANTEYDCNFISQYNERKDQFEYNINLIALKRKKSSGGVLRKNHDQNKLSWQIWINDELEDFSSLCRDSRIVYKDDIIELKQVELGEELVNS